MSGSGPDFDGRSDVAFVRSATADDALEVRRILDAAMLEPGDVEARIDAGDVLVAGDRRGRGDGSAAARILGTLVLERLEDERGAHIAAIGVRRRHRGRGLGRALVERGLEREGRLTARFDEGVRPFYERLGFSIEPIDGRRHQGVVVAED
ncbi:GNAT family N-acetyltransferase [Halopiger xanaduensis]|uniref:GCN5-related N-acetyltransferase n=1 Tax=Halopiger xanaduensis (strain DSM 18323 / JCM 14033 / SH-6) TaxID=797210 RepID=F8DCJ6_HALXS|nr:GNAT family N-acetyltransferase [Halopiger xanaduensis]AEH36038.1 GCN5-related N-acetyltransferase [Halopiger xanaduensis SH-6]